MGSPLISVLIPTFNRAALLEAALASLAGQSLGRDRFEVIVVDDGSTDDTRAVCQALGAGLRLRYFHVEKSGTSAAKNLALFASAAPLVFFFDDDDVADPHLLAEHLRAHRERPGQNIAVLGYTSWAPSLYVTEVMRYVTEVGCFLFSYGNLAHGQVLDFTYFWCGRTSCKRSFLAQHGVFCQDMKAHSEDIELGYRLSRHGFEVVFNRRAVQYMNRPLTYEAFCGRSETQGISLAKFAALHREAPAVQRYCLLEKARADWEKFGHLFPIKDRRIRELEPLVSNSGPGSTPARKELHELYRWMFNMCKAKGIMKVSALSAASSAPADAAWPRGRLMDCQV